MRKPLIIFDPNVQGDRLERIKSGVFQLASDVDIVITRELIEALDLSDFANFNNLKVYSNNYLNAISHADSIISMGGDGTVLHCVRLLDTANSFRKPIIPVNFGTVGFICGFNIEDILNGRIEDYDISDRYMLKCNGRETALNEIAITKLDYGIREFTINLGDEIVANFRADGCIFSTPTGSTAYSFSCSGPIVVPGRGNDTISITPIAPIDASLRPIIIPLRGSDKLYIDSKATQCIVDGVIRPSSGRVTIEKHPEKLKLATPKDFNYFNVLREKLGWARLTQ